MQVPPKPDGPFDYRFGAPNRRYPLADGDAGIARTVQWMSGLARGSEGANHPSVRQTAVDATRGLSSRDKGGQIAAILDWVKRNIDFRGEYKELLQTPVVTIQLGAGDCDDQSMLISSLLQTLGFNTRFSTVAADSDDPNQFTHVFCEAYDPASDQWVAMDSTVPDSFPGWRPNNVYRQKAWSPMQGLGDGSYLVSQPAPDLTTQLLSLAQPIDQALAYKIQGTTPLVADFNFGNLFSPNQGGTPTILGLPWYGALMVLVFGVWLLKK